MKRGVIYILINSSIQGLVKIGKTTRTAKNRAREISVGTGVPSEFEVAYEQEFSDCDKAEKIIHSRLKDYRHNQGREFFRLSVKEAIQVVTKISENFPVMGNANGGSRIRSVISVGVTCTNCATHYNATLKRGESHASCPNCSAGSKIEFKW